MKESDEFPADRIYANLLTAITLHLPSEVSGEVTDEDLASDIFLTVKDLPYGVFPKASEKRKLEEILRLSKRLRRLYMDLTEDTRIQLELRGHHPPESSKGRLDERLAQGVLYFLKYGEDFLGHHIPILMEQIDEGEQVGRRNYLAVSAVEGAARAWEQRHGAKPLSASHVGFASFVADIFRAFDINASVEAQIRSWRELDETLE